MRLGSTLRFLDVLGIFGMIKLAFELLDLSSDFLRMALSRHAVNSKQTGPHTHTASDLR